MGVNATGSTPNSSSILDLNTGNTFTSPNGKGLLPPNVPLTSITDAVTVASPATSLLVYNTATAGSGTLAVVPGYYYWNGTQWVAIGGNDWHTTGNIGTTAGTNFVGTTDAVDLVFKTNALEAVRITTAGNVGISNNAPVATLDVMGTVKVFGVRQVLTYNTIYGPSPTDGFFCVFARIDVVANSYGYIDIYADTSPSPNTLIGSGSTYNVANTGYFGTVQLTIPIRKGEYYKATFTNPYGGTIINGGSNAFYFIPLGH